jgi:hypothetical protein
VAYLAKVSRNQRDALYSDSPENHEQLRNALANCTTLNDMDSAAKRSRFWERFGWRVEGIASAQ